MRILLTIDPAPTSVVVLPKRVAWLEEGAIRAGDVSALAGGGSLKLVAEATSETLGLADEWRIAALHEYGAGLLVVARNDQRRRRFFTWQLDAAAVELQLPFSSAIASPIQSRAWSAMSGSTAAR